MLCKDRLIFLESDNSNLRKEIEQQRINGARSGVNDTLITDLNNKVASLE